MKLLALILFLGALACFLLKAFGVSARVDFMNLGFALTLGGWLVMTYG